MATRAQKAKVGIFLVISAVLITGSVFMIQGLNREPTSTYWVNFHESVLGLGVGGLVEYMGAGGGAP